MQISMKKVIFGNLPTKICTVYRVLLESVDLEPGYVTDKSSYSGQKLTWRDHLWARTQSGEALKVLLSASPLRTIGGQHRFHYKNNLPGLEGQWSAGSGAYSVTDCCSASSRRWQDKEILFILTNFFVDREGAWSFLLLKQHCLWALQVYCVKEIHPDRNPRQIWVSDDTSMSPTLCVGGQWPDAELIPGRGAEQ